MDSERAVLSLHAPGTSERRLALAAVAVSAGLFAVLAPFAKTPLSPVPAFIPAYQSALALSDLVTAALLFGQYRMLRSRALMMLTCAYLFSAAMAVVHMLSFPGLFAPTGLLGAGPQSTAWLYMFWHGGFPAFVVAYALLKPVATPAAPGAAAPLGALALVALAVLASAGLALAGQDLLPPIMAGNHYTPAMAATVGFVWLLCPVALVLLWRQRPHAVLDLWLMVVLCAWMFDIALSAALNAGRYDLGFYAGRLFGLLSATFVLVVLLLEHARLYQQVAHALGGEHAQRLEAEARAFARTMELDAANRQLHEVAELGASAREQERTRIARELHDELAQRLTALKMDLAWLADGKVSHDRATAERVAGMQLMLDDTVATTRRLASDLRPLMLDDLGFAAAAEWLVESFRRRYRIECRMTVHPPELELQEPVATALFRIMQESLTNIARHARGTRAEIDLRGFPDEVFLRVADNGAGFDLASPRKSGSFGLVGLRERVHLVNGRVKIDSAPGSGTTVEVWVPLAPRAAAPRPAAAQAT